MSLYDQLGDTILQQLVDNFYDLVFEDNRINDLFKGDRVEIKAKQFLFLTQFLGGPPRYSEIHGHPQMRMRHIPHQINNDHAQAWLENMATAISLLPIEEEVKEDLFRRFPPVAAHMVL